MVSSSRIRLIHTALFAALVLGIASLAWVQWQGVRTARQALVVQLVPYNEIVKIQMHMALNAGFSIEESLEGLYSQPFLYNSQKPLAK